MSQRAKKTKPLRVSVAKDNIRAVVNRIWQTRYQQGAGYPAVDLAIAIDALADAVRAEERARLGAQKDGGT